MQKDNIKVMIVGTGNVGASIGYCMVTSKTPINELVLVDINEEDAEGEAMDLRDTLAVSPTFINIHSGSYEKDAGDCDVIIITAGIPQAKGGETRMQLLQKNASIMQGIVEPIMKAGFNGIFVVVSNPMDVMTYLVWKYSGLPTEQIIGSGTVLDSARLRFKISEKLNVSPKSVHAYQIGEHGDTEFTLWSTSDLGGMPLNRMFTPEEQAQISEDTKNVAYEIINRKGATYYGIGSCVTDIVNNILFDERRVMPVSTYDAFTDTFFGWPSIIGRDGVVDRLEVKITEDEGIKLQQSINAIKAAINEATAEA
ncbi:L-lactate dehydrogenase [Candidatus Saccharibacteria bacterium]|nr:L-lactate dehydrogenase [Candidatus Saccharibacteria bacterium]